MTTPAESDNTCASCGVTVTPAKSYLSPQGVLCWSCFERFRSEADRAEAVAAALDRGLTRRARILGGLHLVMLGPAAILAPLPSWLRAALFMASLALAMQVAVRRRSAYQLAMGLDVAAALAVFVAVPILLPFGAGWLALLFALLPLALLVDARRFRAAFRIELEGDLKRLPSTRPPWLVPALIVAALVGSVAYVIHGRRPSDPARELMRTTLARWQAARARPGSAAGAPEAAALVADARRWPGLGDALERLDRAWPAEPAVRDAARAVNDALATDHLPYFTDVWALPDGPIVLSYDLVGRVPWRVGAREVDVVRVRRLDTLTIQLGLLGVTQEGQASVLLDRVEAAMAHDLPAMYGKEAPHQARLFNAFDRAALARTRSFLESRLGPKIESVAAALGKRDALLEDMRTRLHGGAVVLREADGFVLGEPWFDELEPAAEISRPGGPLVLDDDLRAVRHADEALRDAATAALLGEVIDLVARTTEAHEARHAADAAAALGPPPPALFALLPDSSTKFVGLADGELRAYLSQLADDAEPACVTLAKMMRDVYGKGAGATPHHYATLVALGELAPAAPQPPFEQLAALCGLPDAELRARVASAWQKLYGEPLPAETRLAR